MRFAPIPILTLALAFSAGAQAAQPVLRVSPFGGEGLSASEADAIQNLVTSYVVELRSFRVIDTEGQELALKEAETAVQLGVPKDIAPLSADYILSGKALSAGGLIVFNLELTKVSSGEKRSVVETAQAVNELILASRRMTRSLFQAQTEPGSAGAEASGAARPGLPPSGPGQAAAGQAAAAAPESMAAPSLALAAGTWKGDKGLDRVSLFPDGRGLAVLSSGATMKVRASISASTVVVVQDQASIPEFYRGPGLDLKSARQVASAARPWKWIFSLSKDGNSLTGVKESVFVRVDPQGAVSVDNNYVREAAWKRLYR